MPLSGLPTQVVQIPLAAGLDQSIDTRARSHQSLDICRDAQFDELGGVQTRHPYDVPLSLNTTTGGTIATADLRRIAENNGELLLFTKTRLYSWIPTASLWGDRGEHPAVVTSEAEVFATAGDQAIGDRCELGGVQFYAWIEGANTFVAARDSTTHAVYTSGALYASESRPRFVVTSTNVLLFTIATNVGTGAISLVVRALSPTSVVTSISAASTPIVATGANLYYDVKKVSGADTAVGALRLNPTTSYTAFTVTSALSITTATKARTADGPIAVASTVAGTQAQIIRTTGTGANVVGDLLTISSLADARTNDAIGAVGTCQQATACYPSSVSSPERCDIYYTGIIGDTRKTSITTAGTVTSTSTFFHAASFLIAHAFTRSSDTHTYVWLFTDQGSPSIQAQYDMVRDDGFLVARSRIGTAQSASVTGSFVGFLASTLATANSDEYAFLGVTKRLLATESGTFGNPAFTARAPLDVIAAFDSNEARRCVRFGKALYISGSIALQYDGVSLTELNFSIGPQALILSDTGSTVANGPAAGSYSWKTTYRSQNAFGEVDRSSSYGTRTTSLALNHTAGNTSGNSVCVFTRRSTVVQECWRTTVNPTSSTPFYLVSSNDPAATNPNGYTDATAIVGGAFFTGLFVDGANDSNINAGEQHWESDGSLAAIPPPPHRVIAATNNRLFIGAISGAPNTVWYSQLRIDGRVAAFNGRLTIDVPAIGGAITGIAFLNEQVIVFRQTAIYSFAGDGLDNTGGGSNYANAHIITTDVGAVNQECLITTDSGIVFQSSKGWHLLDRSLSVQYIGDNIRSFDGETIQAAHLVPGQHQMRVETSARTIIYDNHANQWGEWTINDAIGACVWQANHTYLSSTTGVRVQRSDYVNVNYGMDVETSWYRLSAIDGFTRIRKYQIVGEYESAFALRVQFAYNYKYDGSGNPVYTDTYYWVPSPTTVGSVLQVQFSPSIQQVESVKVRITAMNPAQDGTAPTAGASLKLTAIGLEVGVKKGLFKMLPVAQRR